MQTTPRKKPDKTQKKPPKTLEQEYLEANYRGMKGVYVVLPSANYWNRGRFLFSDSCWCGVRKKAKKWKEDKEKKEKGDA